MTERHTPTPQDVALGDQAMATARSMAADGRTLAVVLDYATSGTCSWCDCEGDLEEHSGTFCAGCPADAYYLVHILDGSKVRRDIPLCKGHFPDFIAMVNSMADGSSG